MNKKKRAKVLEAENKAIKNEIKRSKKILRNLDSAVEEVRREVGRGAK